ncbi:MAG: methylenetetrahydrofolate reductase, partial [Chloroflexota bacterium]
VPTGMIKLIKQNFNAGRDHSGTKIGEPTAFYVGAALNLSPKDPAREIKVLRRKLKNGADFFLTQPVYDTALTKSFLDTYESQYGPFDKPIMVGILPLYSPRHASFLHNEVPGIDIPEKIRQRISAAGEDAPQEGIKVAIELIEEIKTWGQGLYLMPAFNRYEIVAEIIDAIKEKDSA